MYFSWQQDCCSQAQPHGPPVSALTLCSAHSGSVSLGSSHILPTAAQPGCLTAALGTVLSWCCGTHPAASAPIRVAQCFSWDVAKTLICLWCTGEISEGGASCWPTRIASEQSSCTAARAPVWGWQPRATSVQGWLTFPDLFIAGASSSGEGIVDMLTSALLSHRSAFSQHNCFTEVSAALSCPLQSVGKGLAQCCCTARLNISSSSNCKLFNSPILIRFSTSFITFTI